MTDGIFHRTAVLVVVLFVLIVRPMRPGAMRSGSSRFPEPAHAIK